MTNILGKPQKALQNPKWDDKETVFSRVCNERALYGMAISIFGPYIGTCFIYISVATVYSHNG